MTAGSPYSLEMPALGLTIIDLQLPACFPPPSCQFRKRYRNDFLALDFEKQLPVFRVSKLETEFAERTGIRLRRDTFSAEQKNTEILNPLIGLVGVEDLAHHQYLVRLSGTVRDGAQSQVKLRWKSDSSVRPKAGDHRESLSAPCEIRGTSDRKNIARAQISKAILHHGFSERHEIR